MNKYQNLLHNVADKYKILQGKNEPENEWKARVIYSICGLMAYTSLWDEINEEPVSITHLKHRIRSVHDSYLELYPEIAYYFLYENYEFEDEIAKIFLKSGMMYHRPNRISPTREICSCVDNIYFNRGISPERVQYISGIGFFDVNSYVENSISIQEMFQLNEQSLSDYWFDILNNAHWSVSNEFQSDTEFLKMELPFSKGYWTNKPYKTKQVSLLRIGMKGSKLYYLYRYNGKSFDISPIPDWQANEQQYIEIANACLYTYNSLPVIEYFIDGNLVHLHLNYLLPPQELYWLKLYSWPENFNVLTSDFYRKCSLDVFNAFKKILIEKGYKFNEG